MGLRCLTALISAVVFLLPATATAKAPADGWAKSARGVVESASSKQPVMLMLHPGGWVFRGNGMGVAIAAAQARGFEPRFVDYPLFDVPGSFAAAVAAAKQAGKNGRAVYAYGESAGGTLAALLAEKGYVRAAAVQSPVSNIPIFLGLIAQGGGSSVPFYEQLLKLDPLTEKQLSPDKQPRSKRPIYAETPTDDLLSPNTNLWAQKDPNVQAHPVPGVHLDGIQEDARLIPMMNFLHRQDERSRSAGRR